MTALPPEGILHVDMDAFFVSVELLRRPELRGRPVIVGGEGPRGVVAAASYEARAYGVHSALPSVTARRLCPHAVFLPGDHATYRAVSERVMALFAAVTPLVEPLSLDEAFLDVRGARRLLGEPVEIAHRLRERVLAAEGLTCSVGVARTKFLAKLASEAAKPSAGRDGPRPGLGVKLVRCADEEAFLHPMPVSALWGVGPATGERLARLGVETVGDLAGLGVAAVVGALGEAQGRHLHRLANGIDDRPVVPDQEPKSVSHEETYPVDRRDRGVLDAELVRMADAVASRLRRDGYRGRTISIKVRFGDFTTITRSATLPEPVDSGRTVARTARELFGRIDPAPGVRLLGVGVSGLSRGAPVQLALDDGEDGSWDEAETTVDRIRDRFGDRAIGPMALIGPGGLRPKRRGDQQWGPTAATERDQAPSESAEG